MRHILGILTAGAALLGGAAAALAAPAAVVEAVDASETGVSALDFVEPGTVIDLGGEGTLTLGYLDSCVHETIVGGRVTIGADRSEVAGGTVERDAVTCGGTTLALAADEAAQAGGMALRKVPFGEKPEPSVTVPHVSPLILLPRSGEVVVQRLSDGGERVELASRDGAGGRPYVDLLDAGVALAPGTDYEVLVAGRARAFTVGADAAEGSAPVVGRLVPLNY